MGICTVCGGDRRQLDFPILAYIEKGHVLAGFAPIQEFSRGEFLRHS